MATDIKAILKINDQELKETYLTAEYLEKHDFVAYSESFEVIEYQNEVVGFVHLKKYAPDENEILAIAIDNKYQRRGFAKYYMDYISRTLWMDSNCKRILLEVDNANLKAIKFYESIGFVPYRIRVRYYTNGHDAICMKIEMKSIK